MARGVAKLYLYSRHCGLCDRRKKKDDKRRSVNYFCAQFIDRNDLKAVLASKEAGQFVRDENNSSFEGTQRLGRVAVI